MVSVRGLVSIVMLSAVLPVSAVLRLISGITIGYN